MRIRLGRHFIELLIGCTVAAGAANAANAANAACDDSTFRQFDFWIGEWQVHTPDGKLAGTNKITREYAGCVIHEHYTTARGYAGESLNMYDAGRKLWHQTWVDNEGVLLVLEGTFQDGRMRLTGQNIGSDGKLAKHRITWTPSADGSVRQHWESLDANGKWVTAFDGKYTKR